MEAKELIREAFLARQQAYAPYSHFCVGAALLTAEGRVYTGCNIENAAYTPSNCAERTAFFKAVSTGERNFDAIAIVGGPEGKETAMTAPCGVCRQVMTEFCNPETFRVIVAKSEWEYMEKSLAEFFPMGFGPGNLKE